MSKLQPKTDQIQISIPLSLSKFANQLGVTTGQLLRNFPKQIPSNTNLNDLLSIKLMKNICLNLKVKPIMDESILFDIYPTEIEDDEFSKPRPPVVTIMGHVDHGKTSLLDYLRNSNVVAKEAGGITQHLGAFQLELSKDEIITFVDTPGHAAFSSMRAAGANVTDIVILVIAVDDGVKQQTIEALNQAKEAGVKIIIAINKIDLMKNEKMKKKIEFDLLSHDIILESNGGETPIIEISAMKGIGMKELVDEILIQAEFLNLRATQECNTEAIVLETKIDHGIGVRVSAIVKRGILQPGQFVVCGETYGKIKTLFDSNKKPLKKVYPSQAAEIVGLEGIPNSSDYLIQVSDEYTAKKIIESRLKKKEMNILNQNAIDLNPKNEQIDELKDGEQDEEKENELLIIVKVDVQGTLDAINKILSTFPKKEVSVKMIKSGVGKITTSDIEIAKSTKAIIIGMNSKPDNISKNLAKKLQVEIKVYNVIYHLIDYLKEELLKLSPDKFEESVLGTAVVETPFEIKIQKENVSIAGSVVQKGKATTDASFCNILRWKKKIFENLKVTSIYRFKQEVNQISEGQECGIFVKGYDDIQKGDIIEFIKREKLKKIFENLK